jgi:HNH endonuclease
MILGLWDRDPILSPQQPVLIAYDARRHMSGEQARVSLFVPLRLLHDGSSMGWAQGENSKGELISVFWPSMMPVYAEMFFVESIDVTAAVEAAGASPIAGAPAIERARRVTSALVRDRRFSRAVRSAYDDICAVCGLSSGLVVGAHIHPVGAGGCDHVTNGIALCANHHAAFDGHLLWIDRDDRTLVWHPDVVAQRGSPLLFRAAVRLREPLMADDRPSVAAFVARYEHFKDAYPWRRAGRPRRTPITR